MRVSIKACQIRCANSSVWIYHYYWLWNAGEYRLHADEGPRRRDVRPDHTPLSSIPECECVSLCATECVGETVILCVRVLCGARWVEMGRD